MSEHRVLNVAEAAEEQKLRLIPPDDYCGAVPWADLVRAAESVCIGDFPENDHWDYEQGSLNLKLPSAIHTWRRARIIRQATPAWADRKAIHRKYAKARKLSLQTGILHSVDHVIPLLGRKVCGLHIAENLRVMTALENSRKSNSWSTVRRRSANA